jgi:hypothetical protein
VLGVTRRFAEGAAIPPIRRSSAAVPTVGHAVTSWPLGTIALFGRRRFVLRPLRAETETLELAQIEFVEILGGIFLGWRVVHEIGIERAGSLRGLLTAMSGCGRAKCSRAPE